MVELGLARATPVFNAASVSAEKSVAAKVSNIGSTPTSDNNAVPERNWIMTDVSASEGV